MVHWFSGWEWNQESVFKTIQFCGNPAHESLPWNAFSQNLFSADFLRLFFENPTSHRAFTTFFLYCTYHPILQKNATVAKRIYFSKNTQETHQQLNIFQAYWILGMLGWHWIILKTFQPDSVNPKRCNLLLLVLLCYLVHPSTIFRKNAQVAKEEEEEEEEEKKRRRRRKGRNNEGKKDRIINKQI